MLRTVAAPTTSPEQRADDLARRAIDAVRTVMNLGTTAPDEQQRKVLADFPGWGPLAKAFDPRPQGMWADLADELDDAMGDLMGQAARIVDTSFFTPATLVAHVYELLRAAGFSGGSVLDLGCGAGAFLHGAPSDLVTSMTGVEVDPISARIASVLAPQASIVTGELQGVTLPHARFDAAVGNVPFSASRVYDGALGFSGPLHEYFVLRALAAVRPGGYAVLVTSRHTLDAGRGLSVAVGDRADLIAAIRLPSGYFASAGTTVVADVVVLRVREHGATPLGWRPEGDAAPTTLAATVNGRHCQERVSAFWADHPQLVAGTMRLTGFDRLPLAVDAEDQTAAVAAAFAAATPLLVPYAERDALPGDWASVRLTDNYGRKEGSLHVVDGQVVRIVDGELSAVSRAGAELRALIGLRDAAVALVEAESDWERPDSAIEPLRVACRGHYEAYVARWGVLNRGTSTEGRADPETGLPRLGWRVAPLGGFRSDPDAPLVLALETFDQDTGEAAPAPILSRRVNKRPRPADRADSAGEALAICLGEGRGLDLARVAQLCDLADAHAAFDALGDLVYHDPATGRAVIARDYLSGNVRDKLSEALAAAAVDASYERNVAALHAVLPPWLGREDIRIELGSPWVSATDVREFCAQVFGASARVEHIAPLAAWEVVGTRRTISADAQIAYCTERLDAFELLKAGLNGAAPVVWDEVYDPDLRVWRKVRNADATEAAEQKLAAIGERFSVWVWEDDARERRLVERYNHTMNARVLRQHDGSHLTFPGLADGITLWRWQADFVDRAVSTPAAFCGDEVGLGKTLTAITLAMTLRQFGLANRVGFIVPQHLIEQATRQCYQAWPSGKFLIVTRADLHGDARRRFVARCATGDWDLVIMTHETYSSIPVPSSVERDWLEDQLAELEGYARGGGYGGSKRIAAAVRSLKGRIDRLRSSFNDPHAITFAHLGLDYVIVDEADKFRRLPVTTRADGFSLGSSKRALDLFLKISLLRRANPDRPHACLMTGTPFTNTLAEGFVWQSMLTPDRLSDTGLGHFDAWAAQFVRYEVLIETSPDGSGFRSRRRPSVIQNVPELRTMLSEFMSMTRADSVGLKRPAARRHTEVSEPTAGQRAYMGQLVQRADDLRLRRTAPGTDNMLVVCGDGRKVALDPNLVGICEPAPKLAHVAERVAEVYHRNVDRLYEGSEVPGVFQLVLCDLGTPKPGDSSSYGRLRAAMIAAGVPANKIRFVHEASTPKAREGLFAGCRDGRVAVLIGSTSKVGIGTNIQSRLAALFHVDPTWTAAAWEQRNGRAIRNGNHNEVVDIYSFVSRGTFDAYMFGTVERKSRGFEQLYRVDGQAREIEDIGGDGTLTFAELKAAAAGNDLLRRQHEVARRVRTLRLAHVTVTQNVRTLLSQAAGAEASARAAERRLAALDAFVEHYPTMGEIDPARLAEGACTVRDTKPWSGALGEWRDGRVSLRVVDTDRGRRLDLTFDYDTLWSEPLPGKVRRRGPAAVAGWVSGWVAAWIGGVEAERTDTAARMAQWQHRAEDARSTAEDVDLTEPAELQAARSELAEVDAAIAASVRTDTGGAVAA